MIHALGTQRWRLRQLTAELCGHTLNHRQVFSPDGLRVCIDGRNADPDIMITDRIGCVELATGHVDWVYRVPNPTPYGPGVGAVVFHPTNDELLFIHGLFDCDAHQPYRTTRRFGALYALQGRSSRMIHPAESREEGPCPLWGQLRGGTHAHSWSNCGRAISFTYNDAFMESQHALRQGPPDLRTVGVMLEREAVATQDLDPSNGNQSLMRSASFSGRYWSMLVAPVTARPEPGSDALESAREECFLGGRRNVIAFLGRVRLADERSIDEIYVAEWPDSFVRETGLCNLDGEGRIAIPKAVRVRRVTRTSDRPYPGIDGPRHWLVPSINGQSVYSLMRDDRGIVQLVEIDTRSGDWEFVTQLESSIEGPPTRSPSGAYVSMLSRGWIGVLELATRRIRWVLDTQPCLHAIPGALHFLPDEKGLIFHARGRNAESAWHQLWTLSVH